MTFGSAAFGESAFGEPATRVGQPTVQGVVLAAGVGALFADGLQVDAPFVIFSGAGSLTAAALIARQGAVTIDGRGDVRADGSDLETRLLTRNASMRVWTVEMVAYRAR